MKGGSECTLGDMVDTPLYYHRYTSLCSRYPPQETWARILSVLQSKKGEGLLEFKECPADNLISGIVMARGCHSCSLTIRLYNSGGSQQFSSGITVELQKTLCDEGSRPLFYELFQLVEIALQRDKSAAKPRRRGLRPPPTLDFAGLAIDNPNDSR